jgi:hypothetical protein
MAEGEMALGGRARPTEAHAMALEAARLAITAQREALPDPAAGKRLERRTRLPLPLRLKARPLGDRT